MRTLDGSRPLLRAQAFCALMPSAACSCLLRAHCVVGATARGRAALEFARHEKLLGHAFDQMSADDLALVPPERLTSTRAAAFNRPEPRGAADDAKAGGLGMGRRSTAPPYASSAFAPTTLATTTLAPTAFATSPRDTTAGAGAQAGGPGKFAPSLAREPPSGHASGEVGDDRAHLVNITLPSAGGASRAAQAGKAGAACSPAHLPARGTRAKAAAAWRHEGDLGGPRSAELVSAADSRMPRSAELAVAEHLLPLPLARVAEEMKSVLAAEAADTSTAARLEQTKREVRTKTLAEDPGAAQVHRDVRAHQCASDRLAAQPPLAQPPPMAHGTKRFRPASQETLTSAFASAFLRADAGADAGAPAAGAAAGCTLGGHIASMGGGDTTGGMSGSRTMVAPEGPHSLLPAWQGPYSDTPAAPSLRSVDPSQPPMPVQQRACTSQPPPPPPQPPPQPPQQQQQHPPRDLGLSQPPPTRQASTYAQQERAAEAARAAQAAGMADAARLLEGTDAPPRVPPAAATPPAMTFEITVPEGAQPGQVHSTRLDSTRLDSTRLDATRLDSTRRDATRLDTSRLTRLDSPRLDLS